jgi:hypothetical protein
MSRASRHCDANQFGPRQRCRRIRKFTSKLTLEVLEDRLTPASVSVADSSVLEPLPGNTTNMNFAVTRSGSLSAPLTVSYMTIAGSARPDIDFQPVNGAVTFAAGAATATIAIPILNNGIYNNPNLTFSVQLTGIVGASGSSLSFAGHDDFYIGGNLDSIAVGDLNGDGRPDVVVANQYTNSVGVLLNATAPGSDSPAFAPTQNFPVGKDPVSVKLGDINGDGRLDIVVADTYDNTLSVLLNGTPPGASFVTLPVEQQFVPGESPVSVAIGDVNNDGKSDLIVSNAGSQFVSVLLNTTPAGTPGASFLPPQIFPAGAGLGDVVLGDFNGDGRLDVAVSNSQQTTYSRSLPIAILLNGTPPGAPTVALTAPQLFPGGPAPTALAVGDINGDGRPDLAAANTPYYQNTTQLASVLLNGTPPGTPMPFFAPEQLLPVANGPSDVTLADLNGDGKPDLIVANSGNDNLSALENLTPAGSSSALFAPRLNLPVGYSPSGVAAADINGDGEMDLLATNASDGTVSVLLNTTAPVISHGSATGTIVETGPRHDVVVDGTSGNDLLVLNRTPGGGIGDISYALNGGAPVSLTGVTSVTFYGLDGNDTVDLIAGNVAPLVAGPGPVLFDGGTGSNTVIVDAVAQSVRTVPDGITVADVQRVTFAGVSSVQINNAIAINAMAGPDTGDRATALGGLTPNERFVQALYLAELGRPGSLVELDGWAQRFSGGSGDQASIAFAIQHSEEARTHLVGSWYVSYLGRQGAASELAGWVSAMEGGQTNEQVLAAIFGSAEYFNRAQTLPFSGSPDERYVEALYQMLLDREGSSADIAYWSGVSPVAGQQAVAQAFLASTEFRGDQLEGYYQGLLHRPGDIAGRAYWAALDLDIATVRVAFEATDEFFEDG